MGMYIVLRSLAGSVLYFMVPESSLVAVFLNGQKTGHVQKKQKQYTLSIPRQVLTFNKFKYLQITIIGESNGLNLCQTQTIPYKKMNPSIRPAQNVTRL